MTEPQDYTLGQFLSEIEAIIKATPNAINPIGVSGCVYESASGYRHCVIGKWLKSIGLIDLLVGLDPNGNRCGFEYNEDNGNESALNILPRMGFNADVASAAKKIQTVADGDDEGDDVAWGELFSSRKLKRLFPQQYKANKKATGRLAKIKGYTKDLFS